MTRKTDQILMDRLAMAAREGKISRRSFMHYAGVAGVTATAATGLWTKSAAAQPQRGGTFRWGVHDGNSSDTHDPGTYVTRQMIFLAHTHRSYLTMITPENGLGPDLATEWSATASATTAVFSAPFSASGTPNLTPIVSAAARSLSM